MWITEIFNSFFWNTCAKVSEGLIYTLRKKCLSFSWLFEDAQISCYCVDYRSNWLTVFSSRKRMRPNFGGYDLALSHHCCKISIHASKISIYSSARLKDVFWNHKIIWRHSIDRQWCAFQVNTVAVGHQVSVSISWGRDGEREDVIYID